MNYFQGNRTRPQHISVGAVMRNAEGVVRAHYFPPTVSLGYWGEHNITDFYILMRETLEPGETLEDACLRGVREEFNAVATLDDYLGTIVSTAYHDDVPFQKTTIYFLSTYQKELEGERDMSDAESQSTLEWHPAEFLIPKMQEQADRFGRTDVDESKILERYIAVRDRA